jgi:hypothetical protein
LTDFKTTPDKNGYVYVVASTATHRPASAVNPAKGVHWLPFGPTAENYLFFRVGVPAATWPHSPLLIKRDAPDQVSEARRVMGAYYPEARYCTAATITTGGVASCF